MGKPRLDTNNVSSVASSCSVHLLILTSDASAEECAGWSPRTASMCRCRLLRGVLVQHHACGELALVGVRLSAPLAAAMRAAVRAVRAAVHAAERHSTRASA